MEKLADTALASNDHNTDHIPIIIRIVYICGKCIFLDAYIRKIDNTKRRIIQSVYIIRSEMFFFGNKFTEFKIEKMCRICYISG